MLCILRLGLHVSCTVPPEPLQYQTIHQHPLHRPIIVDGSSVLSVKWWGYLSKNNIRCLFVQSYNYSTDWPCLVPGEGTRESYLKRASAIYGHTYFKMCIRMNCWWWNGVAVSSSCFSSFERFRTSLRCRGWHTTTHSLVYTPFIYH